MGGQGSGDGERVVPPGRRAGRATTGELHAAGTRLVSPTVVSVGRAISHGARRPPPSSSRLQTLSETARFRTVVRRAFCLCDKVVAVSVRLDSRLLRRYRYNPWEDWMGTWRAAVT